MNYELPKHIRISKEEEEEITRGITKLGRSFLSGFLFFITLPIFISGEVIKKIKYFIFLYHNSHPYL